jgi:hypothetical protein
VVHRAARAAVLRAVRRWAPPPVHQVHRLERQQARHLAPQAAQHQEEHLVRRVAQAVTDLPAMAARKGRMRSVRLTAAMAIGLVAFGVVYLWTTWVAPRNASQPGDADLMRLGDFAITSGHRFEADFTAGPPGARAVYMLLPGLHAADFTSTEEARIKRRFLIRVAWSLRGQAGEVAGGVVEADAAYWPEQRGKLDLGQFVAAASAPYSLMVRIDEVTRGWVGEPASIEVFGPPYGGH